MKLMLGTKLPDYTNNLINGEINIKNAVTRLNETIQESFRECKINNNIANKRNTPENWKKLDGKELWERIDWSGKLSGAKNHETPDDEEKFNFFKNLYAPENEPAVEDTTVSHHVYMPVTDDPISAEEITEALNQQKSGYNYNNSLLNPLKDILLFPIFMLFNFIFFATTTLVDWDPTVLFIIPKKGNLKLIKNWRGIQVNEYINAWYDRILGNRIKRWMNIDEFQTAYQRGKGCNTQIFTLRTITELAKKHNTPIYISYIDLEKAFDRVRRSTMLKVLINLGLGTQMVYALKNLYSNTNVFVDKIGILNSTCGIRQGSSSSVYIFIVFINGLFQHLRSIFVESNIFGKIHNLIHADDTIVIDTSYDILKKKVISTFSFFNCIDQTVNIGKSKFMCLDNKKRFKKVDMFIGDQKMEYSEKEKYLGHYITDDNSLANSIKYDLKERAANVIVKLRNFINNHKDTTIDIRLKVFQACFCSCILSNCEIWGPNLPKELITLYNKGLKIALELRPSTPTAIIFMESRQPSVIAIVKKRQLKFWKGLNKQFGTELYNLIERARNTVLH